MQNSSVKPPFRRLVFLVITLLIGGVLLSLPPQIQRMLFGLMLLVVFVIALPDIRSSVQQFMLTRYSIHQQHPLRVARVSFVIMLLLLGLSAYFYQPQYIDNFLGFYLFLLSLPFIHLSFALIPTAVPHAHTDIGHASGVIHWRWIGVSIICMTLLTMMNIPSSWVQPFHETLGLVDASPHSQMLLLCVALVSVIWGFGGRLRPSRFIWQRHHTILLGIMLLGGGIRLWNLEYTIHMFVDEFYFLSDVINLNTVPQQILYPTSAPTTDIFAYMQMQLVNFLGPSLTSLRLVTPFISMLAFVAIYSFVRQLFSLQVALISTFLLAVLPVYIQFGRIGMNMVVDPIFGMMGFVYFLRGLRHRGLSDFAMAGVMFGLTHYFYEGGRIFFTLFFILWLIWIILFCRRDPLFRLPNLKQFTVFIFCFTILIVPLYHTLWSHNRTFTQRLDATRGSDFLLSERISDFLLDHKLGYLGAPIQRYVQTVANDNFYQSENAYILPFLVPFFLLGFGLLVWRIRTIHGATFVWWALGGAIANSFIFEAFSAASPRHIVVYGVLMVITAVGLHALWSVLTERIVAPWRHRVQIGFLVILGCIGVYQVDYYFNTIVPNFHKQVFKTINNSGRPRPAYDDMILRAVTLPENTTVHVFTDALFSSNHRVDVPQFYRRFPEEFVVKHMFTRQLTKDYFEALPRDRNHVFTFTRYHQPILEMIEQTLTLTKIEGSPFDIPDDVEMKFYYAPIQISSSISEPLIIP